MTFPSNQMFTVGGTISSSGHIQTQGNYYGVSASLDYLTTTGDISASRFIFTKDLVVAQSSIFGNDITLTEGNVQWLNSGNDQSIMQNFAGGVTFGEPDYPVTFNSNVTASLNMSASGLLFASSSVGNFSNIVVQDLTNGRFYTTSSAGLSTGLDTFKQTGQRIGNSSITGSLMISGSTVGNLKDLQVAGRTIAGNNGGGTTSTSHQFYGISGDNNFFQIYDEDGEEIMAGKGSIAGGDAVYKLEITQ